MMAPKRVDSMVVKMVDRLASSMAGLMVELMVSLTVEKKAYRLVGDSVYLKVELMVAK